MNTSPSVVSLALRRRFFSARIAAVMLLAVGFMLAGASPALARTFNPRLVLSDYRMREYNSMSAAQIQAFLAARPGLLDGMSFPRHDNGSVAPASTIIWESAQAWHISPRVLLTMLQKEQSLLTRTSFAKNTLARTVGAGCPNAYTNRYPGFGNQIWNCGRMLDGYGETSKTTDYVPHPWTPGLANNFTAWVHTDSLATYKLYVYNPSIGAHTPYGDLSNQSCSGNANFWKIYWSYFGNPLASPSPPSNPPPFSVKLSSQSASRPWSASVSLTGTVVSSVPSTSPSGQRVHLETLSGATWMRSPTASQTVGADGAFAFTLSSRNLQRVRVALEGASPPSGCYVVDAAATLTTPTAVGSPVSTANTTLRGYVGPAHSGRISVVLYHRSNGAWAYWKTVRFGSMTSGAWKLAVRLGKGSWRFRASHNDTQHALGRSAWGYASVR